MRAEGIPPVLETLKTDGFRRSSRHYGRSDRRRMQQVIETDKDVFLNVFDIYAETEMAPWIGRIRHPPGPDGENDGGCNLRLNGRSLRRCPIRNW